MAQLTSILIATIANGQSLSDAIQPNGRQINVIQMPSAWTAAVLTFQVSTDGVTYFNLYDDRGNEVFVAADASRRLTINLDAINRQKYLKIRSGTSVAVVAQGAERKINVEVWK